MVQTNHEHADCNIKHTKNGEKRSQNVCVCDKERYERTRMLNRADVKRLDLFVSVCLTERGEREKNRERESEKQVR